MFGSIVTIVALLLAVNTVSAANLGVPVNSVTKYPFSVRILIKYEHEVTNTEKLYACGGVIYSPAVVITVAHCLYHRNERVTGVKVVAGKTDYAVSSPTQQEVKVTGYRIHRDYEIEVKHTLSEREYHLNDFAILWLEKPFVKTTAVKPATFATNSIRSKIVGVALGFGSNKQLNEIQLEAVTYHTCRNEKKHYNGPKTICALPPENENCRNTKGDSGCAFIYNNNILGLVSFGSVDENGNTCNDMPIVMTDITKHIATINQYIFAGPTTRRCPKPKGKYCAV